MRYRLLDGRRHALAGGRKASTVDAKRIAVGAGLAAAPHARTARAVEVLRTTLSVDALRRRAAVEREVAGLTLCTTVIGRATADARHLGVARARARLADHRRAHRLAIGIDGAIRRVAVTRAAAREGAGCEAERRAVL